MENIIKDTIKKYDMLKGCRTVIAGLSGGADSMALIHFLTKFSYEYNIKVIAAHINHNLRGKEAKRDETFVKEECGKMGIPFKLHSADIKSISAKTGETIEECARRIRYEFFDSLSKDYDKCKIATGHNSNDNTETLILNILRGSGLKGLCGIPPLRDNIIRPLIECERAEIENYCKENNIPYVTDSSNLESDYTRNKIRHNVIPSLLEINPSLFKTTGRLTGLLRTDEEYLSGEAKRALADSNFDGISLNTDTLSQFHDSIKARVVRDVALKVFGQTPDAFHINEVLKLVKSGKTGDKIQLWGDNFCTVSYSKLKFEKPSEPAAIPEKVLKPGGNKIDEACGIINIKLLSNRERKNINKFDTNTHIDYDKINSDLIVRTRKQGDIFCGIGRKEKALKKLFIDEKVEREKRNKIPVVADGEKIVWIEGFGVSKDYAPSKNSKKIMSITFERIGE